MTVLIGAYPALSGLAEEEHGAVYAALRSEPAVGGLELPFTRPWTRADVQRAAALLEPHWRVVVTTIPGLVRGAARDGRFGPASRDGEGRREAVGFVLAAHDAARWLADVIGPQRVVGVAVASSPRRTGLADEAALPAFTTSMAQVADATTDGSVTIVEHCDALVDGTAPAKGFLELGSELGVVRQLATDRIRLGINWGRSAIEGRSAATAFEHVRLAGGSGLLASLVFSGCSDEATTYGAAWADAHVPSRAEEPTSLLTSAHIGACLAEAGPKVAVGVKVSSPAGATADERLRLLIREVRGVDGARKRSGVKV